MTSVKFSFLQNNEQLRIITLITKYLVHNRKINYIVQLNVNFSDILAFFLRDCVHAKNYSKL